MKRILLLSFLLCVIFFGCSRKVETADPNEEIIGSDSEIIMEPNPEESSVHEKEPESKYIVTELCPHIDIGHDGGTLFSGGKLWLSAIIYNSEDYDYSEKFIFSVDLDSGNIEEQTKAESEASDRFFDDYYENVYCLASENIPLENSSDISDNYKYKITSVHKSETVPNLLNLEFDSDFLPISDISVDLNGNLYFNFFGDIHIFDRDFEKILKKDFFEHYLYHSMLRLPDGRVAAIFDENGFKIRVFDPETFEFSEGYPLFLVPNSLYSGNSEYDILFIVLDEFYQNLLYGFDFGKEPELIINFNEYIEGDFAVLNVNIDESGNIFAVFSTDKLRYGATEIYKFESNN